MGSSINPPHPIFPSLTKKKKKETLLKKEREGGGEKKIKEGSSSSPPFIIPKDALKNEAVRSNSLPRFFSGRGDEEEASKL